MENKKKKRGCCGIFLWILLIMAALFAALFFLIANGTLYHWIESYFEDTAESIGNAAVLSSLDFDMDITDVSEPDPDFVKLMEDYEDYMNDYIEIRKNEGNPIALIRLYLGLRGKAKRVEQDMDRLQNKKLSLTEYNLLLEVTARLNVEAGTVLEQESASARQTGTG